MAARAPILSFSVCPSWTNSQFSPQKPSGQIHLYRKRGSWLMHLPPFRQGKSMHSFLSMQPLLSGVRTLPSPQLKKQQIPITSFLSFKIFLFSSIFFYLRALVIVPSINTLERLVTNHIKTRFVRRTFPLKISGHSSLSPLSTIHSRRKREMFAFQSYVINTT